MAIIVVYAASAENGNFVTRLDKVSEVLLLKLDDNYPITKRAVNTVVIVDKVIRLPAALYLFISLKKCRSCTNLRRILYCIPREVLLSDIIICASLIKSKLLHPSVSSIRSKCFIYLS